MRQDNNIQLFYKSIILKYLSLLEKDTFIENLYCLVLLNSVLYNELVKCCILQTTAR